MAMPFLRTNFISSHKKENGSGPQKLFPACIPGLFCLHVQPSSMKKPLKLLNRRLCEKWEFVGICNGIVYLTKYFWGSLFRLWNPATEQCREIFFPASRGNYIDPLPRRTVVGFGSRSNGAGFIIVRINYRNWELNGVAHFNSTHLSTWKNVEQRANFCIRMHTNLLIWREEPYWIAELAGQSHKVFLWFDVQNEVFKHLEVPKIDYKQPKGLCLAVLEDHLALFVYSPSPELSNCMDVWIFYDNQCFTKKLIVDPILLTIDDKMVGCFSSGEALVINEDREHIYAYGYEDINSFSERKQIFCFQLC